MGKSKLKCKPQEKLYFSSAVEITVTEDKISPLNLVKLTEGLDDGPSVSLTQEHTEAQQAKDLAILKAGLN